MDIKPEQPLNKLEECEIEVKETKTNDVEIVEWFQKIRDSYSSPESLRDMIDEHLAILEKKNDIDPHHEKAPYYYFFLADAYNSLDNINDAAENIEASLSGFKNLGKACQQSISSWFYGLLLCKQGKFDIAKAKISDAIKILSDLAEGHDHLGLYDEHKKTMELIKLIETDIKEVEIQKASAPKKEAGFFPPQNNIRHNIQTPIKHPSLPTLASSKKQFKNPRRKTQLRYTTKKRAKSSYKNDQTNGYISMPWFPIFESVSAGPNGIVIMDAPSNAEVTFSVIEIHSIPHTIRPVKKLDHQVTLNHVFTYGLVKVEGNSMNNAQPVNIDNGDYVLFSKQQSSEENDIVIASRKIPGGDFAYMVKRHRKRDKLLVSESSEKNSLRIYSPIVINQDYQILGVVIAVAKKKSK